jgi:hypothetical protein
VQCAINNISCYTAIAMSKCEYLLEGDGSLPEFG